MILAFGAMVAVAEQIGAELNFAVANMRFVKPLDAELIIRAANSYDLLVTLEEHVVAGGAGSAVNELLNRELLKRESLTHELPRRATVLNLGLPDRCIGHGAQQQQLAECELDAAGVKRNIAAKLAAMPGAQS